MNIRVKKNPFVTFIVPTYNASRYLDSCLGSIRKQDYPKKNYEIFVVDGGSTDDTLKIAKKYRARVIFNKVRDQETGKSLGIKKSKGSIVVLMDSDNEIVKTDWLRRMVRPLIEDPDLFGVESYYFFKKKDNIVNKYSMLLHISDPYSRMIAANLQKIKKKNYIEFTIPKGGSYPLGANGFLWNKKIIKKVGFYEPKFEESNFSYFAMEAGYRKFARIPGFGIYHYHVEGVSDFVKKRLKIGNKFLNRKDEKRRTWLEGIPVTKKFFSYVYCLTLIGPFVEGLYNFFETREVAWLLHPFMSLLSVLVYTIVFIERIIAKWV